MITFNELKITSDNKNLIIDVSVKEDSYYKNVYLDSITIDNQNSYIDNGPSEKAIYSYNAEGNLKNVRLVIDYREIIDGINNNILFVYAKTKGVPASDTPCGMDNITTIGVAYNAYPLYQNIIAWLPQVNNDCSIPKNFIDNYLKFKAFDFSIKTGNYNQAIKYWNNYLSNTKVINYNKNCNCHG